MSNNSRIQDTYDSSAIDPSARSAAGCTIQEITNKEKESLERKALIQKQQDNLAANYAAEQRMLSHGGVWTSYPATV